IAASTAVAWGYHQASQSELNVFDVISLWNARHEAGRAAEFYGTHILLAAVVLVIGFLVIVVPPAPLRAAIRIWVSRMALLPLLPIVLIGGIVYAKGGGGSQALPVQFVPVALTSLAGAKIALQGAPMRRQVEWHPVKTSQVQNIVMLIDESIRADYLDFTLGNPHTPKLARLANRFVNFGPAVSGGICSNYSNAILRFDASRSDVAGTVNTNPTLWQYAKKAGYRTVFIDAQAGGITNPGLMQNFMTMSEKSDIDAFHAIRDISSAEADFRLAEIIAEELKGQGPVFIYANKNGAHFPYDHSYPASEALYHPTMSEAGADTMKSRVPSYRNAIAWSVDRFMEVLFASADFSNTNLLYTSDHGQALGLGQLTHCTTDNPDPRTALVPLLVASSNPAIRAKLEEGAKILRGRASHFQIAPTVFQWMGYTPEDIATAYDESLTAGTQHDAAFTSGDVFGMFSNKLNWTPIDANADYMEPGSRDILPQAETGAQG
ncbi:MAG TPA: sulfatase-like hydrolase/transferase, partial [Aestuariivirga sp.]|nr:sulfatase-like hydrolase/transferase [Aestuariivirga sp.]